MFNETAKKFEERKKEMSQRALKKRELLNLHHKQEKEIAHQIYRKQSQQQPINAQKFKYIQRSNNNTITISDAAVAVSINTGSAAVDAANNSTANLKQLSTNVNINSNSNLAISRRAFHSTPNLNCKQFELNDDGDDGDDDVTRTFIRSHSDTDLNLIQLENNNNRLVNAKSEFHLKSIASTQIVEHHQPEFQLNLQKQQPQLQQQQHQHQIQSKMPQSKRLSIHSGVSSNTTGCSITSSASDSMHPPTSGFTDVDNIRIPIIGYEVMEERARFTVYKLRVENPFTNDCWLVLRRYTDFQRLNNKLKSTFPRLPAIVLPRKKLFGDNFSSLFLNNRVQGLQLFINSVMANDMLRNSQIVRDFFCLDEPPAYSESMEECRAIFEAQEETIAHLKMQLRAKDDVIMTIQQQLNDETEHNRSLSTAINKSLKTCSDCSKCLDEFLNKSKTKIDK